MRRVRLDESELWGEIIKPPGDCEALSRKLCGSVKGLARGSRTGAFEVELVVGGQNIQSFKNQGVKF